MKTLFPLALALTAACASAPPPVQPVAAPACTFSENDRAWVDHALEAWRFTSREITGNTQLPKFQVVFFDDDCVMTSSNALSSLDAAGVTWTYTSHPGEVTLPDGQKIPVGRISFASGENDLYYFVMSTRSVWDAAAPPQSGSLDVLVPVLLHEGSHVAQIVPYGPRLGALIDRYKLPDDFSDDTLQHTFKDNAEFADSIKRETELFLQAAAAKDDGEAKRLAREALRMLRERQARWLVGEHAYFVEAEDIWLTFEGAGQWAAFQWLVHPKGGAANYDEAMKRFATSRWWSQAEGFAVVMALDRIGGPGWKKHAFGDGAKTVLQMIEEAARQS
jgi:hypothetical protein